MNSKANTDQGVLKEVYSGAADFGKVWAVIGAVIATIFAIIMIIYGIYVLYHRSHLLTTNGTITRPNYNCQTNTDKNGNKVVTCSVDVTYTVDNKAYHKTYTVTGNTTYNLGDVVTVYYEPNDPNNSEINPVPKLVGWLLIIGALLMVSLAWVWVWATRKYKFLAAATGAKGVYDILR